MDAEYFTVRQIAERLQVHPETVREWLRAGRMNGLDFGGRTGWRITDAQFREFIDRQAQESKEKAAA